MNRIRLRRYPALILVSWTMVAGPVVAQDTDSLVRLLDSSDWRVRATTLFNLAFVPQSELPAEFRPKVIELLDDAAVNTPTPMDTIGEGYGSYVIGLVTAALPYDDPASLRGMAFLGVQVNRNAKRFVASHGGTSIPLLDSNLLRFPDTVAVATTWGLMLGEFSDRLTENERIQVLARIIGLTDSDQTLALAWAAAIGQLPVMIPVLELIVENKPSDILLRRTNEVLDLLQPLRNRLSPIENHQELADGLEAVCSDVSTESKRGACESMRNLLRDAGAHLAAGRVRATKNVLDAFVQRADQALLPGAISEVEHALLAGNARFLVERL